MPDPPATSFVGLDSVIVGFIASETVQGSQERFRCDLEGSRVGFFIVIVIFRIWIVKVFDSTSLLYRVGLCYCVF